MPEQEHRTGYALTRATDNSLQFLLILNGSVTPLEPPDFVKDMKLGFYDLNMKLIEADE